MQLSQLISFQSSNLSSANDANQLSNEMNGQAKVLKQSSDHCSKAMNQNTRSSTEQSINNRSVNQHTQESNDLQRNAPDSVANYPDHQNYNNYNNAKLDAKYDQTNEIIQQQLNRQFSQPNAFQQPNRLFCTHGALQNNVMFQLFNNNNNSGNSNGHHQNSNLNDPHPNNPNNASFFNHQTSPYHHYHHHHPTIYHVTTIDPNLNSTLNSTLPDACQTTNVEVRHLDGHVHCPVIYQSNINSFHELNLGFRTK